MFVSTKIVTVLLFEPGRISGHPHAGVTSGRCTSEFFVPTAYHSFEIKRAILQIPVAGRNNLYALLRETLIQVRHGSLQFTRCIFHGKRFGNYPKAEFLVLQSSLAVGNHGFEEVGSRLVE